MAFGSYPSGECRGWSGCVGYGVLCLTPVPGQRIDEAVIRMLADFAEDVGEPGWRIDVVQLGCDDQTVDVGCTLATTVGTGKQPRLAAQGDSSERPLGRVVGEANPPVLEEAGERPPALQHVVHDL